MTQNNLGNALRILGEREPGTARLEEAVDTYRAALLERTRERVPLDWAMTQDNFGTALQTLGERRRDPELLLKALERLRGARKIYVDEAGQTHRSAWFDQRIDAIEVKLRELRKQP